MTESVWPQIITGVSTSIAAILGFILAGLNEARRDRRAMDRDRLARTEERRSAAIRDRHQFQLDTLLALQDAVQVMARLTGRSMHFDHMQARKGEYSQLPPGYDAEMTSNNLDVIRLRNRLLDDKLRDAIERFESAVAAATVPPVFFQGLSDDERELAANRLAREFGSEYTLVMGHLGTALRIELAWLPANPSGTAG